MKKVFVVLEPEEIVRLQGILMDHDGEEADLVINSFATILDTDDQVVGKQEY